jgi:hypothetical protein
MIAWVKSAVLLCSLKDGRFPLRVRKLQNTLSANDSRIVAIRSKKVSEGSMRWPVLLKSDFADVIYLSLFRDMVPWQRTIDLTVICHYFTYCVYPIIIPSLAIASE